MTAKSFPPGPKGNPIFGNLLEYRRDPLGFVSQCAREYGDVVGLRFPGIRAYLLCHPELIETVLTTNHRIFSRNLSRPPKDFTWNVLGNGLMSSEGASWIRQRQLVQRCFPCHQIDGLVKVTAEYTQRMMGSWREGEIRVLDHDKKKGVKSLVESFVSNSSSLFHPLLFSGSAIFSSEQGT